MINSRFGITGFLDSVGEEDPLKGNRVEISEPPREIFYTQRPTDKPLTEKSNGTTIHYGESWVRHEGCKNCGEGDYKALAAYGANDHPRLVVPCPFCSTALFSYETE